MTIDSVKNKLNDYLGESVTIKCNLGRNKYEKYAATIKKLYNNVFIVETNKHHIIKSFSYSDVISKTIRINYKV